MEMENIIYVVVNVREGVPNIFADRSYRHWAEAVDSVQKGEIVLAVKLPE